MFPCQVVLLGVTTFTEVRKMNLGKSLADGLWFVFDLVDGRIDLGEVLYQLLNVVAGGYGDLVTMRVGG